MHFTEDEEQSNCICYQFEGKIYFTVTTRLEIGTELVVTYSAGYRHMLKEQVNATVIDQAKRKLPEDVTQSKKARISKVKSISKNDDGEFDSTLQQRNVNLKRRNMLRRLGPCLALDEWNCKFCDTIVRVFI